MASIYISEPGTDYGPCKDLNCGHSDCEANRKLVSLICPECKKPIGYEKRFFQDGCNDWSKLVHEICYIERIERNRAIKEQNKGLNKFFFG